MSTDDVLLGLGRVYRAARDLDETDLFAPAGEPVGAG
jgi:hypothetical protein